MPQSADDGHFSGQERRVRGSIVGESLNLRIAVRAARVDIAAPRFVQGGSSIAQPHVKMQLLTS
jgi:hypothetical protein